MYLEKTFLKTINSTITSVLIIILFSSVTSLTAQKIDDFYHTDGVVKTMKTYNNELFIGGQFNNVGKYANGVALFDSVGNALRNHPFIADAKINDVIQDNQKNIYVAGDFTIFNGTSSINGERKYLIKLTEDYEIVSSFNLDISNPVQHLFKMGDSLFFSGSFTNVNGKQSYGLGLINLATETLGDFNPIIEGYGGVSSIKYLDSFVFISGSITRYNEKKVNQFVQLNRNTLEHIESPGTRSNLELGIDHLGNITFVGENLYSTGWANPGYLRIDSINNEIVYSGVQLTGNAFDIISDNDSGWFIGGNFTVNSNNKIVNLFKLKKNHEIDTNFKVDAAYYVKELALVDSFLFVKDLAGKLVVLNALTGNILTTPLFFSEPVKQLVVYKNNIIIQCETECFFYELPNFKLNPVPSGVQNIEVKNDELYIATVLSDIHYGGAPIANFDLSGKFINKTKNNIVNFKFNGAIPDGKGGYFYYGTNIVHIDSSGSLDTSLTFNCAIVKTLKIKGDSLYIGGNFYNIKKWNDLNYTYSNNFAIVSLSTKKILAPPLNFPFGNSIVNKIDIYKDSIILAGYFTGINGISYNSFAMFSLDSFKPSSFKPNFATGVNNLYQKDSSLYVSGNFSTVNSSAFPGLCRINLNQSKVDTWQPIIDSLSVVWSLTADSQYLYAIGQSKLYNSKFWRIDRLTGQTALYGNISDSMGNYISIYNSSEKIIQHNDTLIISGSLNSKFQGYKSTNCIKVNKKTGEIIPFSSAMEGDVTDVLIDKDQYIVVGELKNLDKQGKSYIHKFDLNNMKIDTSFHVGEGFSNAANTEPVQMGVHDSLLFFGKKTFENETIDGKTRNYVFAASRTTGKIANFNAKLPLWGGYQFSPKFTFGGNNKLYISNQINNLSIPSFVVVKTYQDSFNSYRANNHTLSKDNYGNVYVLGTFNIYNEFYGNKIYNPKTKLFTAYAIDSTKPGAGINLVFLYNYNDSLYYYYNSADFVNFNLYRYNKTTNNYQRLNFLYKKQKAFIYRNKQVCKVGNILYFANNLGTQNITAYDESADSTITLNLPTTNNYVGKLYDFKGKLMALGNFTLVQNVGRKNLFSIDLLQDKITKLNIYLQGTVLSMDYHDSTLFVGGSFYAYTGVYNNIVFNALAGINTFTNKITKSYNFPYDQSINMVQVNDTNLYVMGNLTNIEGSGINNFARFSLKSTNLDNSWNPKLNQSGQNKKFTIIDSFAYLLNTSSTFVDGKTYSLGGKISLKDGKTSNFTLPYNYNEISSLFKSNNHLYITGGYFNTSFQYIRHIKSYNANTLKEVSYNPKIVSGSYNCEMHFGNKILISSPSNNPEINDIQTDRIAIIDAFEPITYPLENQLSSYNNITEAADSFIFLANNTTNNGEESVINNCLFGSIVKMNTGSSMFGNNIQSFSPKRSGNVGKTTITINGIGFSNKTMVLLIRNQDTITMKKVSFISDGLIKSEFLFNGNDIGGYRLFIDFGNGIEQTFSDSFYLEETKILNLTTEILGFDKIRANRNSEYSLEIKNNANVDLQNVPVFIAVNAPDHFLDATDVLNPTIFNNYVVDSIANYKGSIKVYSILLPKLEAFRTISVQLTLNPKNNAKAEIYYWTETNLDLSLNCFIETIRSKTGKTIDSTCFKKTLVNVADSINAKTNSDIIFGNLPTLGNLINVINQSVDSCGKPRLTGTDTKNLIQYLANAKINGADSACFNNSSNQYDSAFVQHNFNKFSIDVINSLDPNDKIGPRGVGNSNAMKELPNIFPYRIRFENDSTATAPAQRIVVIDTIDTEVFDINKVEFTRLSIGNFDFNFASNQSAINKYFDFKDKANLILHVEANVDKPKGIITWIFTSLDVKTLSFEKLNPSFGFLPPNNSTERGQGSVYFNIGILPNAKTDKAIRNRADIIFDENKSILTPYWEIKLDSTPPESNITKLSPIQSDSVFLVEWNGYDVSGIKYFDIYKSQDNVHYQIWQPKTLSKSSNFTGKQDSIYYFYSIATDSLDNVEGSPNTYDALTKIDFVNVSRINPKIDYQIFPNPTSAIVYFKLNNTTKNFSYNLYNTNGSLILSKANEFSLDISTLPKAVYIIHLAIDNETFAIEKIILN